MGEWGVDTVDGAMLGQRLRGRMGCGKTGSSHLEEGRDIHDNLYDDLYDVNSRKKFVSPNLMYNLLL